MLLLKWILRKLRLLPEYNPTPLSRHHQPTLWASVAAEWRARNGRTCLITGREAVVFSSCLHLFGNPPSSEPKDCQNTKLNTSTVAKFKLRINSQSDYNVEVNYSPSVRARLVGSICHGRRGRYPRACTSVCVKRWHKHAEFKILNTICFCP